jgi:N6-adenosine-specific RNA methylase IME4
MSTTESEIAPPDIAGAGALVKYDAACKALADAKSVDEVKNVRDVAMAMKLYARQAKNKDLEADAFEVRKRAEHRLGEMIAQQKVTIGLATGGEHGGKAKLDGTRAAPSNARPTLAEAGVDKKLSSLAQRMYAMPAAKFEEMINDGREQVQRGAEKRVLKEVKIAEARASYEARAEVGGTVADLHALVAAGKRFPVILADPPWNFSQWSGKSNPVVGGHYRTMSFDQIKALPVAQLAEKDAVLLVWGTWPNLLNILDVVKIWGFVYQTAAFVWAKQNANGEGWHIGNGYYTRSNTEFCLLARPKSGPPERDAMGVHQLVVSAVREHSRKPDEVHDRIEQLWVGPYLELFARAERPGWVTWGNEVAPPSLDEVDDDEPWDGTFQWDPDPPAYFMLRDGTFIMTEISSSSPSYRAGLPDAPPPANIRTPP